MESSSALISPAQVRGAPAFPSCERQSSETCDCVLGVREGRPGLTCCSATIDIRFNSALSLYLFVQFGLIQITLILL